MVRPNHANLVGQSNTDNSNVNVKIKIYYTTAFATTSTFGGDINLIQNFVTAMLAMTNDGFRDSDVKITANQHGNLEELTNVQVPEGPDSATTIAAFRVSKGDVANCNGFRWVNLRAGADAAALLVSNSNQMGSCGKGKTNGITNGETTFVVAKNCVRKYTFGHELGHNFGLQHNIENARTTVYHPDGYGYLVKDGNNNPAGIRTIMAYKDSATPPQYPTRVNYYSNKAMFINHGTHTNLQIGAADLGPQYPGKSADSAAVLNRMRFSFAQIGKNIYIA